VKPNIFIISIDSLRYDYVSAYGQRHGVTPFWDKLASEGLFYKNAYTAGLWTDPAITSLYTGLYPSGHRILAGLDTKLKARTLAKILADNGYITGMVGQGSGYLTGERNIING